MNNSSNPISRINVVDLLRGTVMIIMALDHTRGYVHNYSHNYRPTDLVHTTSVIFFTRWITHFCAPVFVFLSGTSAYLAGRKKTKRELSAFLIKRGIWLMLLEVTVIPFARFFDPGLSLQYLEVIWVLGLGMIILAGLIHLPWKAIFAFGIVLILFHNLLDPIHVTGNSWAAFAWSELHEFNAFTYGRFTVHTAYPIIPWIGVTSLGYCF